MIVLLTALAVVLFGVWVGKEVWLNTPLFVVLEHVRDTECVMSLLGVAACGLLACLCRKLFGFAGHFRYRNDELVVQIVSGLVMTFFVEDKSRSVWWRAAGVPWPAIALLYNTLSDHVSGYVLGNIVPSYLEHLHVFAVELLCVAVSFSGGMHCSHRYHVYGSTLDLVWAVHLFYAMAECIGALAVHVLYFWARGQPERQEVAQGVVTDLPQVLRAVIVLAYTILCTVIAKSNERTFPLFPLFWAYCALLFA